MKRVLVAVDFTPCAEDVARRGGALARELGAQLVLLHVVPTPQVPLHARLAAADARGGLEMTVDEYLHLSTERRFPWFLELVGTQERPVRTMVRIGDPAQCILDEAEATAPSMIVMGTHGRHGLARMVYGSVAERVVRRANVPVVVVRSQHDASRCEARSCNWCTEGMRPPEEMAVPEWQVR